MTAGGDGRRSLESVAVRVTREVWDDWLEAAPERDEEVMGVEANRSRSLGKGVIGYQRKGRGQDGGMSEWAGRDP